MIKQQTLSKFGKKSVARFAMILAALSLALPLSVIGSATPASYALALSALVEQSSFRIIISNIVHLGDSGVGDDHEVIFSAPNVDASQRAVLMLRTRDVDFSHNVITINGVQINNLLLPHSNENDGEFFSESGIVPANTLTATNNTLRISARNVDGDLSGNLDDFDVDNVVLIYKQQ
jgi:hypothetical protein